MSVDPVSLGILMMWSMMIYVLWMPATWLLMTIITPKSVMQRYFKEPHFTFGETIWLAQFPGSLLRTAIFSAASLRPQWGKRRQMTDFHDHAPRWFVWAARTFLVLGLGQAALTIALLAGLLIYTEIVDAQNGAALLHSFSLA